MNCATKVLLYNSCASPAYVGEVNIQAFKLAQFVVVADSSIQRNVVFSTPRSVQVMTCKESMQVVQTA